MGLLDKVRRWAIAHAPPPFKRTVCACNDCVSFCKTKPGSLIPSDVGPIGQKLVEIGLIQRKEDVGQFLRATRGSIVQDLAAGKQIRVPGIGPARDRRGRCFFLDDQDRCRIHGVSPFGCAYFDAHMERAEIERRQIWAIEQVRGSEDFQTLRSTLKLAEGGKNESY
jgi:hypothetical protein